MAGTVNGCELCADDSSLTTSLRPPSTAPPVPSARTAATFFCQVVADAIGAAHDLMVHNRSTQHIINSLSTRREHVPHMPLPRTYTIYRISDVALYGRPNQLFTGWRPKLVRKKLLSLKKAGQAISVIGNACMIADWCILRQSFAMSDYRMIRSNPISA